MNRVYLCMPLVLALMAAAWAGATENSKSPAEKSKSPLDADTIKVALHTATPEENGFIDYVLKRVDKGTLPLDLVESTFLWARKKPRRKFQYFKQGLILRAADQGIKLCSGHPGRTTGQ
jgi:hypothetical protein